MRKQKRSFSARHLVKRLALRPNPSLKLSTNGMSRHTVGASLARPFGIDVQSLSIGDLIADNFDREGIVYSKERRPSIKWLAEQEDARVQQSAGRWWRVLCLNGGSVIVPTELCNVLRRATVDDLLKVMQAQQTEYAGTFVAADLFKRLSPNKPKDVA